MLPAIRTGARLNRGVLFLITMGFAIHVLHAPAVAAGPCAVLPFNNLGMHCMDNDFSQLSILPPFNVLNVFVIQTGPVPQVMKSADVNVFFQAIEDPNGSINTSSVSPFLKTNFWKYVSGLFGVSLRPDFGLTGVPMPGPANTPRQLTFIPAMGWFSAQGIPITDRDDSGRFNPYPMMRAFARNKDTHAVVGSTPVTIPISTESICQVCHETGNDGASPGFHGVTNWSTAKTLTIRVRQNILTLHDALNGTNLMKQRPVLCNKCHYSAALDLAGTGPTGTQINPATHQPYSYTSHAVHRHHGSVQLNGVPIPDEGINTCYYCHPGARTQCLRGPMSSAGLVCQNCHGSLLGVANPARRPWIDTPKCQSCHTGNALDHIGNNLVQRIAYAGGPDVATPILANSLQFAENPDPADPGKFLLFRNSKQACASPTPSIPCSACHGSPHAEWPVASALAHDNATPVHLQGYASTIMECAVCHGPGFVPAAAQSLDGPHGMHVANGPSWWGFGANNHKAYLLSHPADIAKCQGCHGAQLEGSPYSRLRTARTFLTGPQMASNKLKLNEGTQISCFLCHPAPPVP